MKKLNYLTTRLRQKIHLFYCIICTMRHNKWGLFLVYQSTKSAKMVIEEGNERFPDNHFPGKTFPGRLRALTRRLFPYKTFPEQSISRTDVSRTICTNKFWILWKLYRRFPDNHFPGQTFPGQDFSRTSRFPDKTFPGQDLSRTITFPDRRFPDKSY